MTNSVPVRTSAKRISIFNHKGGVGKTTLTFNLASQLADMGKRVLIVDSDPQCNLSAYVIDPEVLDDLLDKSDTASGQTVWSAVKPIVESSGAIKKISAVELPDHGRLSLLPGDIRLSDFESDLNDFWRECFQRKKRGFIGTTALSWLVSQISVEKRIDYIFYDTGPNIGPLNRVILLDCDYFIVPVAYDLFSVRALKTLGRSMFAWVSEWDTISKLATKDTYLMPGLPKFLGYIPQNFTIYGGSVASHQSKYAAALEKGIGADIVNILRPLHLMPGHRTFKLGEVKDFGQLVTASQRDGTPIYKANAGNQDQRNAARLAIRGIADRVIKLAI